MDVYVSAPSGSAAHIHAHRSSCPLGHARWCERLERIELASCRMRVRYQATLATWARPVTTRNEGGLNPARRLGWFGFKIESRERSDEAELSAQGEALRHELSRTGTSYHFWYANPSIDREGMLLSHHRHVRCPMALSVEPPQHLFRPGETTRRHRGPRCAPKMRCPRRRPTGRSSFREQAPRRNRRP